MTPRGTAKAPFLVFLLILLALSLGVASKVNAAPAITECGTAKNVTPSTLASALKSNGCSTLVLSPGTYPKLYIYGRSVGVLTLRCAERGKCYFGTTSIIWNSNGIIVDGVTFTGGANGLYIKNSRNVLVRRSTFI